MKKIFAILTLVLCFSITACSCKEEKKQLVLEDAQYADGQGNIDFMATFDTIQEKIDSKANFVFYMYGATCSGCHKFTPILLEYVKENGINIYAVEVNVVYEANKELKQTLGCTPSVAIFKGGEIYDRIDSCQKGQAEYFLSKEGFGKWFESYVVLK